MNYNDQYMMHKRAYHQVHRSHDTPFFYPATNIHDQTMFSNHPNVVSVHHYNHQIPQEILMSPSSRTGGVSSIAASSNKTTHPIPSASASSTKVVVDEPLTNHVPFEQRFLFSEHNEFGTALHEHQRNRYHHKVKSRAQTVSDSSSSNWYNEPVEFYPVTKHKLSPRGSKYHPLRGNNGEKLVRRVRSFHQNSQSKQPIIPRHIVQPIYADHSQIGTNFNIHQYLAQPNQRELLMGDIKLRQPVERHYSTLGHRKKPVVHQVFPSTKTNPMGIMIRGGNHNFVHKSQSLRRTSPYNIRRFPTSMAYPVSELLQHNHIVTINDPSYNKNTSIQSEGGSTFQRDVDFVETEEAAVHSMPSSFARRFNSSVRGRKKRTDKQIGVKEINVQGFDDVLTITRLSNREIEENDNDEIHTVSLESNKLNTLPNKKHNRATNLTNRPCPKNHLVKINNYVGSLDRIKQLGSKNSEHNAQFYIDSPKMQSLDYKTDKYNEENNNSFFELSQQPMNILANTLTNIEETPLNIKNQRPENRTKKIAKKSSSFSTAISRMPNTNKEEQNVVSQMTKNGKCYRYD